MSFDLSPVKPPCRGCTRRSMKCHSSCKDYKEFRIQNDAWLSQKQEKYMIAEVLHKNKLNRFDSMRNYGAKYKHGKRAK